MNKVGYNKIRFCGGQAIRDGLQYFWVDTCCIDKSNSTELQEAVNSMFRWYQNASKCYVYLSDVSIVEQEGGTSPSQCPWESAFRASRWFTRGWTLQELLAPNSVEFFSQEGKLLGNKKTLEQQIHEITRIAVAAIRGAPLSNFTVEERLLWAENRQTTREEDKAYSLLGIFNIYMPLIYGERREHAFRRLREEIEKFPPTPIEPPMAPDPSGGLDWASRGTSHVDFGPDEILPLLEGRFLGYGANGGVFETTVGAQKVAWKRQFCRRRIAERELQEIADLKKLNGRHIIKLVGTYTRGPFLGLLLSPVAVCDLGTFLEDADNIFYRDGDIEVDHQAIQQRLDGLGIQTSLSLMAVQKAAQRRLKQSIGCISSAIAYLHQQSIRHKNIKPSNVLLSSSSGLWVTDFGLSTDFSDFSRSSTNNSERGTPKYFAPEVAEFAPNGRSADIFSLACVFFELIGLCNGYSLQRMKILRPNRDLSFHANLDSILHWFNFSGTQVTTVADSQLMALVREMFSLAPQERPIAIDIKTRLQLVDVLCGPSDDPLWGECCATVSESRHGQDARVSYESIRLGNTHQMNGPRHEWCFYIHAPAVEAFIVEIHFFLHSSFAQPYKVKKLPPYELTGGGWGHFTISIIIALNPGYSWVFPGAKMGPSGHSFLPLDWRLNFEQNHTYRDFKVGLAPI